MEKRQRTIDERIEQLESVLPYLEEKKNGFEVLCKFLEPLGLAWENDYGLSEWHEFTPEQIERLRWVAEFQSGVIYYAEDIEDLKREEQLLRELTREEEEKFAAWYREKHELEDDEEIDFDNFRVFDGTTIMTMNEKDYSGFVLDVVALAEL